MIDTSFIKRIEEERKSINLEPFERMSLKEKLINEFKIRCNEAKTDIFYIDQNKVLGFNNEKSIKKIGIEFYSYIIQIEKFNISLNLNQRNIITEKLTEDEYKILFDVFSINLERCIKYFKENLIEHALKALKDSYIENESKK